MLSFLSLPYEIRKQIYDLSLLTCDFICPYKASFEEKFDLRFPRRASPADLAIGLLGTNSFVRNETLPIFYGGNTWHLSLNGTEGMRKPSLSVFKKHYRQFRKIHVSFDVRDLSREDVFRYARERDEYFGEEDREAGNVQNIQTMHELLWCELASRWQWKMVY